MRVCGRGSVEFSLERDPADQATRKCTKIVVELATILWMQRSFGSPGGQELDFRAATTGEC